MRSKINRLVFLLGVVEYVVLRWIRSHLFSDRVLTAIGRFIPYYQLSPAIQAPDRLTDEVEAILRRLNISDFANKTFLDYGAGATNDLGHEMVRRGFKTAWCYEPYRPLAAAEKIPASDLAKRVQRIKSFDEIPDASIDVLVSTSVIEHLADLGSAFNSMAAKLKPRGIMIHFIDLRDHFFKYPYHFLLFRKKTWDRFLNPGDLPRWRLSDVLANIDQRRFRTEVMAKSALTDDFERIKNFVSEDFNRADPDLEICEARIAAHKL